MSPPGAATILKFVLAGAVGVGGTLGIAGAMQPGPTSTAIMGPVNLYADESAGDGSEFGLIPDPPGALVPLDGPPQDQRIQLAAFPGPQASASASTAPAWWASANHSRVPVITQFDGSPQQSTNCVLASGAMLARLGFGIVTTGSQLRLLQSRPTGGTTLRNLEEAVDAGWGVQFPAGVLTRVQFRALVYAGAGAVLLGMYGQIPVSLRLQKNYTGAHGIYIDGFRPPVGGQPAAYWVNDPIGRTWAGYRGAWWPADVIEDFATAFGNGHMVAAWTFAGGATPPARHPALPPDAYPTASSEPAPTASGTASASPTASLEPIEITLPSGDLTPPDLPAGDDGPAVPDDVSPLLRISASAGNALIVAKLSACLAVPKPAWCPPGVPVSVIPEGGGPLPSDAGSPVVLLFASAPQPGLVQVVFSATGSGATFEVWPSGAAGSVQPAASLDAAVLGGKAVWIATFPVVAGHYEFAAGANGTGIGGVSKIGVVTVGP